MTSSRQYWITLAPALFWQHKASRLETLGAGPKRINEVRNTTFVAPLLPTGAAGAPARHSFTRALPARARRGRTGRRRSAATRPNSPERRNVP